MRSLLAKKAESAYFPEENSHGLRNISLKTRKGQIPKKVASKSKKLELNCTNLELNSKKTCSDCTQMPDPSVSSGLKVKSKTTRVLLDSGSSGDLLFIKKGSSKHIFIVKQVVLQLGCTFLQESSGFLCFLFLWCFFHRNHDSCSAVTFLEPHQETCLYGAYVVSYVGYQFVRQTQSRIKFYGTLQWLLSTTIAASPPPLLRRHCCATTTTATPIAAPPLPLPLLRRLSRHCTNIAVAAPPKPSLRCLSRCCTAIAVAVPPLLLLHRHCHCCATIFSVIAAPIAAPPLLHRHNGDRRQ
jgi:hypothetical protein